MTSEDILRLAAAAECEFTHPVARAMIGEARGKGIGVPAAYEVKYHIGRGVEARIRPVKGPDWVGKVSGG